MMKLKMNDEPITAVCVVEDLNNCPDGFMSISKTYDTEFDADLWKESNFFSKKVTRYLCISKNESIADYVLENLAIINDKEILPEGYGIIPRTIDTDQKVLRKKQLCYKLSRQHICSTVITDIILLSKSKNAPDGYTLIGDLNGLLLCAKSRSFTPIIESNNHISKINGINKNVSYLQNGSNVRAFHDNDTYENVIVKPIRPAPTVSFSCKEFSSSYQGLQGVPFILNNRLETSLRLLVSLPSVEIKTKNDIDKER